MHNSPFNKLAEDISYNAFKLIDSLRMLSDTFRQARGRFDPYTQAMMRRNQPEDVDFYRRRDLMRRLRSGNLYDQGLSYDPRVDPHIQRIGLDPIRDPRIYGI